MAYTKTTWRNNQSPAINADNLNHIEQGVYEAHQDIAENTQNIENLTTQTGANTSAIALEKTQRQQADTAETLARENADNLLSARMDTFTQLPSGSTSGDAELIDIRVGADGVTYPTAGDAVRGQVSDLKSDISKVYSSKLVQQSDLVFTNSNFTVSNGSIVATELARPFNCAVFDAEELTFKYKRRNQTYQLYVGVSVNGHFVGNQTANVVSTINEIYDNTNAAYSGAHLVTSIGDAVYGSDYSDYTATLKNQRFTLKKGDTTIFEFYIDDGVTIDGIAFLNYYITEISGEADLKEVSILSSPLLEKALAYTDNAVEKVNITGGNAQHRIVAGVIRNNGNGWDFITDTNHQGDLNCVSVSANSSGQIVLDYSGINAKKIISFLVAPDETFASLGYMVGASVGKSQAYMEVYQNVPRAISGAVECKNDGTITLNSNSKGISSVEWNSQLTSMVITHDAMDDTWGSAPLVTPYIYSQSLPRIASMSGSSVRLEFVDVATGSKLTEVSNKMSFMIYRADATSLKRKFLDANNIINVNGNFWFIGIFEV